jgi:uncharacterized protein (DUF3084 family)
MAKSPLDRLASLGEEVLGKAQQNPAAHRLLQGAMQMKDRVDDLSKRVRGLEQMEKRLATLEKRVSKVEYAAKKKPPPAGAKKTTTAAEKTSSPKS